MMYSGDEDSGDDITSGTQPWDGEPMSARQALPARVFSAGWNMPGYLPESEPTIFATWDDAKAYMIDELLSHADTIATWAEPHDCDDVPCPTYGDDCPNDAANNLAGEAEDLNLDNGPEWSGFGGNLHYWIVTISTDELSDDEAEELADIL